MLTSKHRLHVEEACLRKTSIFLRGFTNVADQALECLDKACYGADLPTNVYAGVLLFLAQHSLLVR